jgi:ABC-2 type transport system permease protein
MNTSVLADPDTSTRTLPAGVGLTWRRVLAADARRLRTLRSTWWFTASLVLFTVALGAFPALGVAVGALDRGREDVGVLGGSLSGINLAEILVAAFAVLSVTAEYASGAVTSTFTAVPRRTTAVLARAGVVIAGVLVLSLALTFGTFAVAHALLGSAGVELPPTAPGVVRSLVGAALALVVVAALAVASGWLLRGTAGALAAVLGIFYLLPVIGFVLPAAVARHVLPWLPSNAAAAVMEPSPAPEMLPAGAALAALIGYAVAALALAAVVVRRRDL